MLIDDIVGTIKHVSRQLKPQGRYRFLMIDNRSHHILLDEYFFTLVRAKGCLNFHNKITSTGMRYQLIDTKTGKDITHE